MSDSTVENREPIPVVEPFILNESFKENVPSVSNANAVEKLPFWVPLPIFAAVLINISDESISNKSPRGLGVATPSFFSLLFVVSCTKLPSVSI